MATVHNQQPQGSPAGSGDATAVGPPSLATWNVSAWLGPEYVDAAQDLVRLAVIQLTIQLMLHLTDSQRFPFFTVEFVLMLLYLVIGVLVYWLVVRKLIGFA